MSGRVLLLLIFIFAALVGAVFVERLAEPRPVIDLVATLDQAERRSSTNAQIVAREESIRGDTRRAIPVYPLTRVTWKLTLPNGARLRTALGMDQRAWEAEGNGTQFRVAVSTGGQYKQLFVQQLDPHGNPADRRWMPVSVDLSRYGGQRVDLILSTECGPGRASDCRNDYAFWGAPAITLR